MEPHEVDTLLQRLTAVLERQDERLERIVTLHEITNERLARLTQQMDRTDATHAGISLTLVQMSTALERHAQALDRLDETLRQMLPPRANGREA